MQSRVRVIPEMTGLDMPNEARRDGQSTGSDSADGMLIAQILSGESCLFQTLVDPYSKRLYRMALAIVRNQADAEDVVQESCLKAFLNLRKFRFEARFSTWLTSIALNEAKALVRARRHIAYESIDTCCDSDDNSFMDIACSEPLPPEIVEELEFRRLVARALQGLHPTYREIYDLREIEEFSTEMAAEHLGIPIALAKTRLHRARKMLHQRLTIMMGLKLHGLPAARPAAHE
jgi:RNA polymerase sigma-70 factor (ECF subfamily)